MRIEKSINPPYVTLVATKTAWPKTEMKNEKYTILEPAAQQADNLIQFIRTLNITTADQEVMQVEEEYAKFEATSDE